MPANPSGSVLVRWEHTPQGIVLKPFYSSMESAPTFRRIAELLASVGGATHLHVKLTTDGGILLSNPQLREEKRCSQCGGLMFGPRERSVCGDCQQMQIASEAMLDRPVYSDAQSCPQCGTVMIGRGVATVCDNCGYAVSPC